MVVLCNSVVRHYDVYRIQADAGLESKTGCGAVGCVPSQINYVLKTRFNISQGYIVESKRGGGGYIRITCIGVNDEQDPSISFYQNIGREVTEDEAENILQSLNDNGLINQRQLTLFRAALYREITVINDMWRPTVRAILLKALLLVLVQEE